jgi:uncharacterized protein (TIGR03437 family)
LPAWTFEGTISAQTLLPGDTVSVAGTLRIDSPGLQNASGMRVGMRLNLLRLSGPDGTGALPQNSFASTLLTPTGLPIESSFHWLQGTQPDPAFPITPLGGNRAEANVTASFRLPSDLPAGYFRPIVGWRLETVPRETTPPDVIVDRAGRRFGYHLGSSMMLPVVRVGNPAAPRVPWMLLGDNLSNGTRGVRAIEDRTRFGLASKILTQSETFIVPRLDPVAGRPITYRLEPFAPTVSVAVEQVPPAAPLIPFRFPSGRLVVRIQKPDGSVTVLGPAPFLQARMKHTLDRNDRDLDPGGIHITAIYQLSTMDPRFEVQFEQDGLYQISLEGTVDDVWGNTWNGGGTYAVHVARQLSLDTSVLPGTPFEVGDVFDPGLTLTPPAPATVEVRLQLLPNSDASRMIEHRVQGLANRFGYFQPAGSGISLDQPGEYRLDVTATWRDSQGKLWMGSRTWGGVVAPRTPAIIARGRRGIDEGNFKPQWFFRSQSGFPTGNSHVFMSFHSGDVMWLEKSDSLNPDVRFQDPSGSLTGLMQRRGWPGGTEPAEITAGEAPLFTSRPDGFDLILDPSKIDLWAYSYSFIERPLVRVREQIRNANVPGPYWRFSAQYQGQIGVGPNGDLENDIKFQYAAAVIRGPAVGGAHYAIYGSLFVLVPDNDPLGGTRVFPPFQGNGGGPGGGPIMKLKGKDIDLFLHLTGVRPGSVLEVGDTFAVAGAVGPPLPAFVAYAVVTPGGRRTVYSGRANKVGYYYRPEHDFVIDEPGLYTVDLRVTYDGQTSAGQVTEPFPAGDVLGSANGRFYVYAVPRNSAALAVNVAGQEFSANAASGHVTTMMPGFLLETRALQGPLRYRFDPVALARDFPNLDVPLADVVTISLFANHQARVLVYHGEEFFQTDQTPVVAAPGAVVNAATFTPGPVAPGSLATLFGANLASVAAAATRLPLPATLGGATLRLNGIAAPLLYASPGQINFQVPWELTGQTRAALEVSGGPPLTVNLAAVSPGIFAVAPQGRFLTLYCTGLGAVTNRPASGAAAPGDPLSVTTATPAVTAGGVPATVLFSGLAPGFAGLYQLNVELRANTPTGAAVPVVLLVGGAASNTVTVAISAEQL